MLPIIVVNNVVTFSTMRIRYVIVTKTIWSITWTKLSNNKTMSFAFKFTLNVCINEHFGLFKVSGITSSFILQNYRKIMLIGGKGIINKIWAHTILIWSFIPFNKRIECIISWCWLALLIRVAQTQRWGHEHVGVSKYASSSYHKILNVVKNS